MDRPNLERLDVLCLDDNSFMHEVVRSILAALRIKSVRYAFTCEQALEMMRHKVPDLLVVDLELEDEDGATFIRDLRRLEDSPDPYLPIIALSAYTDKNRVIAARDAGATEVLAKPISARTLYDRLVYMAKHSRLFIKATDYVGPDRRRLERPYQGEDKRTDEG